MSEYSGLGVPLVRVEIPAVGKEPAFEKLLGAASIFRVTPCTEEVARRAAASFAVRPLELVYLPPAERAQVGFEPDDDDDLDDRYSERDFNDREE